MTNAEYSDGAVDKAAGAVEVVAKANKVEYDAHTNEVYAVTVFQTSRAEVKRKISVNLEDGQNDVEVINLPSCLEESSIRVDGIGNATIFDVIYHAPPPIDESKLDEVVQDLLAQKQAIQSELAIVNRQTEILTEYSKTLNGKDTTSPQLEFFLDTYATRQAKYDEQKTKLEADLKQVEKDIEDKSVAVNADAQSTRDRGVRVTIVVLAEGAGPAELSLTYIVSNAWWAPQYDLRAKVAAGSKGDAENAVAIHYRAAIGQRTGEDWVGVELTLSTASPLHGTEIPTLVPQWIVEKPKYMARSAPKRAMRMGFGFPGGSASLAPGQPRGLQMAAMLGGDAMTYPAAEIDRAPSESPPEFFRVRGSAVTEGAMSTTFSIPGLSTIPADTDKGQQTHRVSIAELDLSSVDLEWISVPKETPSAFLRCKVKNATDYLLLPGDANVFLNGNFVAKSQIPRVSPQETFSCSLGVDPAIRVTYHPQSKKSKSQGGSILSSKTHITTFEQSITLKNTRLSRVHRLLLRDQVPVSNDSRFKVNILRPRVLAAQATNNTVKNSTASTLMQVSEGIKVRWAANMEEDENGISKADPEVPAVDSARGRMEWVIEMDAGASVDVNLSWEITAPLDVAWAPILVN